MQLRSPTSAQVRLDVAHLARRAGFGLTAEGVDALAAHGFEEAVARVCDDLVATDAAAEGLPVPAFDTAGYLAARQDSDPDVRRAAASTARRERRELVVHWLRRMVVAERPAREKLTLLWHDHFATSVVKVRFAELMWVHYRTLYESGVGRFDDLVGAVARDPAMLIWLDGRESTSRAPNENYAREHLELFTLGHGVPVRHSGTDHVAADGGQPYDEGDVSEAARACTGWQIDRTTLAGRLMPRRHDDGTKSVLAHTGRLGLLDVVDISAAHPACAPHVVARLWSRIGRPAGPDDPVVQDLAQAFARDQDLIALLRRMFLHTEFRTPDTRTALIKMPVEWWVGAARALGVMPDERALGHLAGLGQVPFVPPDVAGWPANEGWLSTATARARLEAAMSLAAAADTTALSTLEEIAPVERPGAVGRLLGVDQWGRATSAALADTTDDLQALLTVALVAPETLLN